MQKSRYLMHLALGLLYFANLVKEFSRGEGSVVTIASYFANVVLHGNFIIIMNVNIIMKPEKSIR